MNLPEGNEGGLGPLNGLFHREQHLHFFCIFHFDGGSNCQGYGV